MLDLTKIPPEQLYQLKQDIERERCRIDIPYFVNDYVKIEERSAQGVQIIPFELWESQQPVLQDFIHEKLVQVMKANQLGLTWLILSYAVHEMTFVPGFSVKAISESELKAKEIIRRVDLILRYLPDYIVSQDKEADCWYETTSLMITIHHKGKEDSIIQAFAASPMSAAGFTVNLFLLDEWALQAFAHEIWSYVYPTINREDGGKVIGISTIERGTLFEEIWKTNKNFKKIFLGWNSDPRRNQAWYDKTIEDIGLDETRKHYPATPEEALAIPGGTFFAKFNSAIHIKESLDEIPAWYAKYRVMDYGLDMLACYFVWVDGQGFARVYKEVYAPNLVISEAAYAILKASGADMPTPEEWGRLTLSGNIAKKQAIAQTAREKFACTFAPPDLFARLKDTGKEGAQVWYENGIPLMKSKNDFEAGCLAVNNWLNPITLRNEQTGESYQTARLTIDVDCAPSLVHSLLNIQKDKHNPNVYAKQPHDLTHAPDALRYLCTEIVSTPIDQQAEEEKKQSVIRSLPYYAPEENQYDGDLRW